LEHDLQLASQLKHVLMFRKVPLGQAIGLQEPGKEVLL
jgi:hypothetical protein